MSIKSFLCLLQKESLFNKKVLIRNYSNTINKEYESINDVDDIYDNYKLVGWKINDDYDLEIITTDESSINTVHDNNKDIENYLKVVTVKSE